MIVDRNHLGFLMQMIDRGHLNAADGYVENRVLDILEFLDHGSWGVRKPYGNSIHENDRIRDL